MHGNRSEPRNSVGHGQRQRGLQVCRSLRWASIRLFTQRNDRGAHLVKICVTTLEITPDSLALSVMGVRKPPQAFLTCPRWGFGSRLEPWAPCCSWHPRQSCCRRPRGCGVMPLSVAISPCYPSPCWRHVHLSAGQAGRQLPVPVPAHLSPLSGPWSCQKPPCFSFTTYLRAALSYL